MDKSEQREAGGGGFFVSHGFTLLEVLIALVIIAIALVAVELAVERSVHDTDRVREKMAAHWVAMNVISRMQVGLLAPPLDASHSGDSPMLGREYEWTSGIDQKGNGYYERVYVDVKRKDIPGIIEHLIGFIKLRQ